MIRGLARKGRSPDHKARKTEQSVAQFKGTERYVATRELEVAVNAAVALERPLLIKGEPGTGKTMLAQEVAIALGRPLLQWHIKFENARNNLNDIVEQFKIPEKENLDE